MRKPERRVRLSATNQQGRPLHLLASLLAASPPAAHLMRLQWLALALLATRASAAIFTNPLAGLADMMGPTEGPISTRRGNFAIPAHPNLRTLQETPPVYEIPGART